MAVEHLTLKNQPRRIEKPEEVRPSRNRLTHLRKIPPEEQTLGEMHLESDRTSPGSRFAR